MPGPWNSTKYWQTTVTRVQGCNWTSFTFHPYIFISSSPQLGGLGERIICSQLPAQKCIWRQNNFAVCSCNPYSHRGPKVSKTIHIMSLLQKLGFFPVPPLQVRHSCWALHAVNSIRHWVIDASRSCCRPMSRWWQPCLARALSQDSWYT